MWFVVWPRGEWGVSIVAVCRTLFVGIQRTVFTKWNDFSLTFLLLNGDLYAESC